MTPFEITLLLHIYARRDEIPDRGFPSQRSALDAFVNCGLVTVAECKVEGEHEFKVTERGKAYVDALTALPLPVSYWRIPMPPQRPMMHHTWEVWDVRGPIVASGGIPIPD